MHFKHLRAHSSSWFHLFIVMIFSAAGGDQPWSNPGHRRFFEASLGCRPASLKQRGGAKDLIEASYIATRSLVEHVQWIQPEDAPFICQPLVHRGLIQSMPSACMPWPPETYCSRAIKARRTFLVHSGFHLHCRLWRRKFAEEADGTLLWQRVGNAVAASSSSTPTDSGFEMNPTWIILHTVPRWSPPRPTPPDPTMSVWFHMNMFCSTSLPLDKSEWDTKCSRSLSVRRVTVILVNTSSNPRTSDLFLVPDKLHR